ncbi:MAG: hydrogenase expression/formation protein HypE [bacterium]|nr:hydrogenase expression/formation protein HypE [bacterium]
MNNEKIQLAHGSGGKLSQKLIKDLILKYFGNPILDKLDDSGIIRIQKPEVNGQIAYTTDSYVVSPLFFPGGNIGKLAVCGTINDLAMVGAVPQYLTVAFIIEEGFSLSDFEKILNSMRTTARSANVLIVAGDTKVVNRGNADKIYISSSGIGLVKEGINISGSNAQVGDKVLISGTVGDHGMAILAQREDLALQTTLKSDCAPLNSLVQEMLKVTKDIHCLRDPTRGGLASTLNEIAQASNVGIKIDEPAVPVRKEVRSICDLLGFDPLYVANEGKLVAVVKHSVAEKVLAVMKKHKFGKNAAIIGEVISSPKKTVLLKTSVGGTRILDMLSGEQLPRIC